MNKNRNKKSNKNGNINNNINGKRIIDLTSYISPDMVQSDTNGSYTGTTDDTFYRDELEEPVQDADDL